MKFSLVNGQVAPLRDKSPSLQIQMCQKAASAHGQIGIINSETVLLFS